ncbi:MAG: lactate utilization protein [Clostridia bacterium]|nr:lactate utilization protein [Clostridia bacterium]
MKAINTANIEKLISNLARKGFKPSFFQSGVEAVEFILDLIPQGASVGFGGSMTVKELSLDKKLESSGKTVYSVDTIAADMKDKLYDLANSSDWYISSTNALTEGGDFVNIDGRANRVSALAYGVKNVIYVLGVNKVTPDLDSAIDRIRNHACALNARRLDKNTPCKLTGECCYCDSEDCICNVTLISHHPTRGQENVYAVIINESLGY